MSKHWYKLVFESDKFILSKKDMFIGKGFADSGMFKLNLMNKNVSAYIVDSFTLWHGRLGHVNYNVVNQMVKFGMLPSNLINDQV